MQKQCAICKLDYEIYHYTIPANKTNDFKVVHATDSVWCRMSHKACIFCDNYLPMRDERATIMKNGRHHYLLTGSVDEQAFNKRYVEYVDRWCDLWHIGNTDDCQLIRTELLTVRNWSREYWH